MSQQPPQAIRADTAYPLPVFAEITGLGRAALRSLRKKGLPVRYVGRRGFVRGGDFLEFVGEHGDHCYTSQQGPVQ